MQEKPCGCLLPPVKIIGNRINGSISSTIHIPKQEPKNGIRTLQNSTGYSKEAEVNDKLIKREGCDIEISSYRNKLDENIIRQPLSLPFSESPEHYPYTLAPAVNRLVTSKSYDGGIQEQKGKATGVLVHGKGYMRLKKSSTSSEEEEAKNTRFSTLSQYLKMSPLNGLPSTDSLSKKRKIMEFSSKLLKRRLSSSTDHHDVPEKKVTHDIDIVTTQNENRMILDRIFTNFREEIDQKLTLDPRDIDYQPPQSTQSSIWGMGRVQDSPRLPLSHITERAQRYPIPRYSAPRIVENSIISDKLRYHHPVIVDRRSQNFTITHGGQVHTRHGSNSRVVNDQILPVIPHLRRSTGHTETGQENYNVVRYNVTDLDADWDDDNVFYPTHTRPTVLRDRTSNASDDTTHSSEDDEYSSTETTSSNSPAREQPQRKTRRYNCFHLWEFLRDTLNDETMHPKCMEWTDKSTGEFRLINPAKTAALWGSLKTRRKGGAMSYEKMARAMRFYYKKNILEKVPDKKLHFRFSKAILSQVIGPQ